MLLRSGQDAGMKGCETLPHETFMPPVLTSDEDLPDAGYPCPICNGRLKLAKKSASPSPRYEAHTFVCLDCGHYYTKRVETE